MNETKKRILAFLSGKRLEKAKAEGGQALEMLDINDNPVVFEVNDASEIAEGVKATPDGTFTFADGKTITIEGGVVTAIETPQVEETETTEETVAEGEEEIKEEIVEEKIAELEKVIEEKDAELEKKDEEIKKLEEEVVEAKAHLQHINDFAKSLGMDEPRKTTSEQPKAQAEGRFVFKRK